MPLILLIGIWKLFDSSIQFDPISNIFFSSIFRLNLIFSLLVSVYLINFFFIFFFLSLIYDYVFLSVSAFVFKSSKQHCNYRPERLLECTVAQNVKHHCLWTNLRADFLASNHKLIDDSWWLWLMLLMSLGLLVAQSAAICRLANYALNWFDYRSRHEMAMLFRPM